MDHERIDADADVIDTITGAIGYRPLDAFVALPYCEHDEAPLVVADLPLAGQKASLRRFSTAVTAAATREPWAHSVIVVLYTSKAFGEPSRPSGYEFVWAACQKMHQSGLHPTGIFCVATDGWGEYSLRGEEGERFERRALAELTPFPTREL